MTSISTLPNTGGAFVAVRPIPNREDNAEQNREARSSSLPSPNSTGEDNSEIGVSGFNRNQTNLGGTSSVTVQIVEASENANTRSSAVGKAGLTEEEQKQVAELKAHDREVRTHEQAHANVGAPYTSAPSYEFQRGPDGQQYAVAGQVQIDSAPVPNDPEATIQKLEVVQRAALAPAEPSSQDRAVAAQAAQGLAEARAELLAQRAEERPGETEEDGEDSAEENANGINSSGESAQENSSSFSPTPITATSFGPSPSSSTSSADQIINLFA